MCPRVMQLPLVFPDRFMNRGGVAMRSAQGLKQGAGSRTYYTLMPEQALAHADQLEQPLDISDSTAVSQATHADEACNLELATLPPELATFFATLKGRVTEAALREGIHRLCNWRPLTVDELATFLGKSRQYLRNKHLIPMVREGELRFLYPESAKHPHQAYVAAKVKDA